MFNSYLRTAGPRWVDIRSTLGFRRARWLLTRTSSQTPRKTLMKKMFSSLVLASVLVIPTAASAYLVGGTKWGDPAFGTGANVSWSLMASGTSCATEASGCTVNPLESFMPSGFLTQIQNAFASWSAVANITFTQVADDGAAVNSPTTSGDIRVGAYDFSTSGFSGALAYAYFPFSGIDTVPGDIFFNTGYAWDLDFAGPGFSIFGVMAHEIGHSIGLDHTDVANSLMNPFYSTSYSGVQADDAAGAQFIYGTRLASEAPEPTTLALLGLALLGLTRRRQAAANR